MRKRSTKSWSCNPAWLALLVRALRKMRFASVAGIDMVETIHTILTLVERKVFSDKRVGMLRRDLTLPDQGLRPRLGIRLLSI